MGRFNGISSLFKSNGIEEIVSMAMDEESLLFILCQDEAFEIFLMDKFVPDGIDESLFLNGAREAHFERWKSNYKKYDLSSIEKVVNSVISGLVSAMSNLVSNGWINKKNGKFVKNPRKIDENFKHNLAQIFPSYSNSVEEEIIQIESIKKMVEIDEEKVIEDIIILVESHMLDVNEAEELANNLNICLPANRLLPHKNFDDLIKIDDNLQLRLFNNDDKITNNTSYYDRSKYIQKRNFNKKANQLNFNFG